MTVLTKYMALPHSAWAEVTGPLAMADGKRYAVEVLNGHAEAVDVVGTDMPASTAIGHAFFSGTPGRPADYRAFEKNAGRTWWFRAGGAGGHIVATEI